MSGRSGAGAGSRAVARPLPSQVRGLRRASAVALVLLLIQYMLGIGINLYVQVPHADQGHDFGTAIVNGPAAITIHIVVGLLLVLAAIGLLVQAIRARLPAVIVASAVGLVAIAGAMSSGAEFVHDASSAASMTMAVLTGVAMLGYASSLYLLIGLRQVVS